MAELDTITTVAIEAARKAGAIQKEKYGGLLNVDAKLADDIKLEADRLCEKAIVDTIRKNFPSHAILAEESGRAEGAEYIWYVDPLDGTVNFYFGIPYFCTTLACYRQTGAAGDDLAGLGQPLVGVTYCTLLDEMFVGVMGKGTTLNGKPVRVREETAMADAYLITAIGNNEEKLAFTREVTFKLSLRVTKTRNLGAAALDLAQVAAGRASGFFEAGVNAWDFAAGRVLVEAAGGLFHAQRLQGEKGKWALVASGHNIHGELRDALAGNI